MTQQTEGHAPRQPAPLRISRRFDAPPEVVFEAWSSADHVSQWFCPKGYSAPQAKVELRVGGPFEVCMRSPEGRDVWTRGTVAEVIPNERLVLDLYAEDDGGRRLFGAYTEVTFTPEGRGTRLDVVQTYTSDEPSLTAHMTDGAPEGWTQTLDKLEAEIRRMQGSTRA